MGLFIALSRRIVAHCRVVSFKIQTGLFATRGGDCGGRSACYRGEGSAPCYAIFRGSRVPRGLLCGGGMDPAPLLELERVFNA